MPDQQQYNLAAIRQLLLDTFPGQPQDLLRFCRDHPLFQPIMLHFGHKYSLLEMIDEVVDYCQAHILLEELEAELRSYTPPQHQLLPEAYSPLPPRDADELPEPGRLPPGSRLPFGRNALFTGRERPLKALAQALLQGEPGSTLITQAIQGMGGIGKTQLAVEFAYRYGRFFQGVHWLACAKPESIHAEIAACGEEMRLQPWPRELPDQVDLTLQVWGQDGRRHLVVLDNLEDPKAGGPWLQRLQTTGAALLVTSRERRWPKHLGLAPLRIRVFSQEESRTFLRQYLPASRASSEEVDQLADKLGHLPLALELAGCYLDRAPTLSVATFLGNLETVLDHQGMQAMLEELGNVAGYERGLLQSFALSWAEVKDPSARRLFRVAGNCAPNQPIPCELLAAALGLDEEACAVALGQLTGLGLLDLADREAGPTLHSLLAEFARALPPEEDFDPLAALAAALVTHSYQASETGLPARCAPLRPHLEAVAPATEESDAATAATLWTNLGYHQEMNFDYGGARTAYEHALTISEPVLGPDHPDVAIRLNNLGCVLQVLNDLPAARQHLERALEMFEKLLGPDDPHVATVVDNLSYALEQLGELPAARAYAARALAIREKVLPAEHPSIQFARQHLLGLDFRLEQDG